MPQDILDMGEAAFENLRGTFRNSETWPLASPSDMFDVSCILHILTLSPFCTIFLCQSRRQDHTFTVGKDRLLAVSDFPYWPEIRCVSLVVPFEGVLAQLFTGPRAILTYTTGREGD